MKRLILFCVLFLPSVAQAVIISAYHIKNTLPELAAKKFVLFGDYHESRREDIDQLSALINSLHKKDRESSDHIHVLVEGALYRPDHRSVIGNLMPNVEDCRHVTVQNIEIRCHTIAAAEVLNSAFAPETVRQDVILNSADSSCRLGDVTFADVDREITHYKSEIDNWASTLPPLQAQAVHDDEPLFKVCWDSYKQLCETYSATPSTRVLDLSHKLYDSGEHKAREYFSKILNDLGSALFNMHIYKTVLSLKSPDIIVLIAGALHTSYLAGFLQKIGNNDRLKLEKADSYLPRPLSPNNMDVNDGCYDSCYAFRTWVYFAQSVLCSVNH